MRPVSVLHVTETARGGIGTCINLFASFDAGQVSSHVVAPAQHAAHIDESLETTTFERPDRGLSATLNMVRTAHRVARRINPNVILCHSSFSLSVATWFRLALPGRPIIFCPNGLAIVRYEEGSWKHRIARAIEGFAYRIPSIVVHVSRSEEALADHFRYPGSHTLIENAMPDLKAEPRSDLFSGGAAQGKTNLLFVGRLDRQKGFDILTEAARQIEADRPDIAIHVVGASVNNDAKLDALPSNLIMHGWVDHREIDNWYRSADALIVPSRWEGLPFVVVEALRSGTPALVSDRAGMPEIIDHDQTGKVFHLNARDIAATLRELDCEALRAMRPAARATYEKRFAVDRFLNQYSELLFRLLPEEAQGSRRQRCA